MSVVFFYLHRTTLKNLSVIFDGDQRFNCSQNPVDQGRLSLVQPDCVALLGRGLSPTGFRRTVLTSGASPSRRLRNYSF